MSRVVGLVILAYLCAACWAFNTGAPSSACDSMTPGHGTPDTASIASSYTIMTSKNQYSPGDRISVTVSGNGGTTFIGFFVQVRQGNTAVGTMTTTGGQIACNQAAATHTSNAPKSTISIDWTAPAASAGNLQVWVTIVQSYPVWTTMKNTIISAAPATTSSTTTTTTRTTATTTSTRTTATTTTTKSSATGSTTSSKPPTGSPMPTSTTPTGTTTAPFYCGTNKSCFKSDFNCKTDCDFLLTWQTVGSEISFEMNGATAGYIAVGFSNDLGMGDDNVIMCTNRGEVTNRYQPSPVEPEPIDANNPRFGLTSSAVASSSNGRVNCSFSRAMTFTANPQNPVGSGVNVTQIFDLTIPYYLFLARGNLDAAGDPVMHNRRPAISMKKVDLSKHLVVVDRFPPFLVGAAGLTVDTAFIIRNSIFGLRSQITVFSLLMMKMLL